MADRTALPTHEKANYITCPKGHKIYVIWSPERQMFAFTCDECGQHSQKAVSVQGVIEIKVTKENHRA